jgi:hypothetical protein
MISYRVFEHAVHLLDCEPHRKALEQEAKARRRHARRARGKRLGVVHAVVNLVHDFMVRLELAASGSLPSVPQEKELPRDEGGYVLEFAEVGRLHDVLVEQRVEIVRRLIAVAVV